MTTMVKKLKLWMKAAILTLCGATVRSGIRADVAPSVLHIMGLQQPKEMTGQCLISE